MVLTHLGPAEQRVRRTRSLDKAIAIQAQPPALYQPTGWATLDEI